MDVEDEEGTLGARLAAGLSSRQAGCTTMLGAGVCCEGLSTSAGEEWEEVERMGQRKGVLVSSGRVLHSYIRSS